MKKTMEDFDYLAPESNAAWLDGRGDGRFEQYEQFYRDERARLAEGFDLKTVNEGYQDWAGRQPSRLLSMLSAPWFGRVAVVFFCLYMGSRLIPLVAKLQPVATGGLLIAAFVALRVFHWRRRRRRT
ncbi:hypothetical protein FSB08_28080 [Paraburkholderia sp. JPY432]|uniref:hypothetical protein n=1 Tax=Paraburkholderia youngii TaxID=2782701 RepID=UPI001594FAFE|nr:hypothetical protein [Paraburkholderia youngii]NVH76283.1 hypothetical protein [Paraburkholderia youngii]